MRSGVLSKIKHVIAPGGSVVRTIPFGAYKGLRKRIDFNVNSQVYLGLWERETYAAIRKQLFAARWCIDVGAGVGELAVLFAKQPNTETVIAIEPSQPEVEGMADVMRLNAINPDRILIIAACAGTTPASVAIDSLDVPHGLPGFFKIDVDGGELDVLHSASNLLDANGVHVLVETHSAELERGCIAYLEKKGYRCHVIRNAWWRFVIPEQRPVGHNRWLIAEKPARFSLS